MTLTAALEVGCLLALEGVGWLCRDAVSVPSALGMITVVVVGAAFAG